MNSFFIDIGEKLIKGLLVEKESIKPKYIGAVCLESKGIKNGRIENIKELEESIMRIIYQAELENPKKIHEVYISISVEEIFDFFSYKKEVNTKNGIIEESDLPQVEIRENNLLVDINKKFVIGEFETQNPIGFHCDSFIAIHSGISIHKTVAITLGSIIRAKGMVLKNISYANFYKKNRMMVDIGYSSTRCFVDDKIFQVEIGYKNLEEGIAKFQNSSPSLSYLCEKFEAVELTRKFVKTIFQEIIFRCSTFMKKQTKIELYGFASFLPFIAEYVNETFDLETEIIEIPLNFPASFNVQCLFNCYHQAEKILS